MLTITYVHYKPTNAVMADIQYVDDGAYIGHSLLVNVPIYQPLWLSSA